jgi:hypothetical protein
LLGCETEERRFEGMVMVKLEGADETVSGEEVKVREMSGGDAGRGVNT